MAWFIASEENIRAIRHSIFHKKEKESTVYNEAMQRGHTRHFPAGTLFDMDEKTKNSFLREYRGTTTDGRHYTYNLLTDTYTVSCKSPEKWARTKKASADDINRINNRNRKIARR